MSLDTLLAQHLPKDEHFKYIYIQSKPTYIKSPINIPKSTPASTQERPDTVKIRHFFSLIDQDVIVLGIEVFTYLQIYPTCIDQYIYVSKCDTTGLKKLKFRVGDVVREVLRYIVDYDVERYRIKDKKPVEQLGEVKLEKSNESGDGGYTNSTVALIDKLQRKLTTDPSHFGTLPYYNNNTPHPKTSGSNFQYRKLPTTQINCHICLFTKTAPQYIFPNSSKNKYKHLGNGQVLLKWWLRIIESVCGDQWPVKKLIIPGSDTVAMRKFIDPLSQWSIGHIFSADGSDSNHESNEANAKLNLAVYNIPLFPDDPKGRFLEHLIVENRYFNVSVDRFYQELGFRQEFRLGDCVGLIGCSKSYTTAEQHVSEATVVDEESVVKDSNDAHTKDVIVVSIHHYKQFINNVIKLINFDKLIDVEYLTQLQIPSFFKETIGMDEFEYGGVAGEKKKEEEMKKLGDVTGEKRKLLLDLNGTGGGGAAAVNKANDLTGLIKRKRKN